MLGGAHLRFPIEPSQVGEQVGAIVLDRGHHVVRAALLDQAPGGVVVGVHRVEGHDAAGEVEPGDQGTHGRDLVALVLDRLLSEDDSRAVLRSGDEQVLGARIVPGGTADVLPVDGDGVGARGLLRGPGARRAVEHIGVQVGENLDERGRGRGGEAPQTGAVERPQGTKLMLGQRLGELADCGRTVVSGKLRGDRDGQDRGERIAPPARAAEIGHTYPLLELLGQHRPNLGAVFVLGTRCPVAADPFLPGLPGLGSCHDTFLVHHREELLAHPPGLCLFFDFLAVDHATAVGIGTSSVSQRSWRDTVPVDCCPTDFTTLNEQIRSGVDGPPFRLR